MGTDFVKRDEADWRNNGSFEKKYHESERSGPKLVACDLFMQQVCSGEVMLLGAVYTLGREKLEKRKSQLLC